ncbi:ABC-type hemin transport system ATPase subunit [Bradyrhizobium sp. USDA 4501]
MAVFTVKISNCNSVDEATIEIVEGALNIKYGPNGLGKSTLAKAIVSQVRSDGSLQNLVPFKNRGKTGVGAPTFEGVDNLNSALVFDEEFVQQFAFQKDEVVKNSFEIFI